MRSSDNGPKPQASERERKLAEALRANLRRRKSGPGPGGEKPAPAKTGDKD
jgi:hypothetical protein